MLKALIFLISTHTAPLTRSQKKPQTHTHTHSSVTCTIQQTMQTNSSIIQDLSTSFHNRLVLALSVGVQFLWHGKIGMFLPYKNKCVEFFSWNFHNVKKNNPKETGEVKRITSITKSVDLLAGSKRMPTQNLPAFIFLPLRNSFWKLYIEKKKSVLVVHYENESESNPCP